jgi:hypothetical protein
MDGAMQQAPQPLRHWSCVANPAGWTIGMARLSAQVAGRRQGA